MNRILTFLAGLIALCSALPALAAPPASSPSASPRLELARPALWKLADEDTTIYLFGTVHALPPGIAWYRGLVAEAFEGSAQIVTEIPETDPAHMQKIIVAKAMLPRDKSLRGLMSAEEQGRYEKGLAAFKLPAGGLDRFEPWYAAISLASMPLMRAGYVSENGVENLLEVRAKALGRERIGLETADYQLGLFDALPAEVQKRFLLDVVDTLPDMAGELAAIVDAWKSGQAERLAQLMNEQEDDPEVMRVLLFQRNQAWADWIRARMAQPGQVFIAVGAGHLAGPGSVQEELAARGLAVSRVQ